MGCFLLSNVFCFQINRTLNSEKGKHMPAKTQKELKIKVTRAGLCQSAHQLAVGDGISQSDNLREVLEKISIQNNIPIERNIQIYYTLKAADVLLGNKDLIGIVATIQWWRPTSGVGTNWTLTAPIARTQTAQAEVLWPTLINPICSAPWQRRRKCSALC